jgi:predicted heme/steroid binding protein
MPWSSKEVVNNQWVDVDPKGRFYLASDGRVYDSVEDVWYNHHKFDQYSNKIDYDD